MAIGVVNPLSWEIDTISSEKRLSLTSDLDKGGLKAPHLESIIKSQGIMCEMEMCRELRK